MRELNMRRYMKIRVWHYVVHLLDVYVMTCLLSLSMLKIYPRPLIVLYLVLIVIWLYFI